MSFSEAIATQPAWVQMWLNVLLLGAFAAPLVLLIWKASRKAGLVTLLSSLIGGASIQYLYGVMGYVKLIGIGHILWLPVVVFLIAQQARGDMPKVPRWIIWFIIAVISVSLIFDFIDVIRWIMGERAPLV